MLNLFYDEPDPDRWLPFDRYPRRLMRWALRGSARIGGQHRVYLNLCAGLDRLGIAYRSNDYHWARKHPDDVAGIIGKPCVLDKIQWRNPILFGAAVYSHPLNAPDLLRCFPIRKVLVPGEWMRKMFEPWYGDAVMAWPVGIDTEKWKLAEPSSRKIDFLLYDKVRWRRDEFEKDLIQPIRDELGRRGLRFREIRYGFYEEGDFHGLLQQCQAMIFLCEHETQGIAYQQALSCGVPILAWDRGGFWQDPEFYPDRVRFGPVSSVPYWDDRCGMKFGDAAQFSVQLELFMGRADGENFKPRDYIVENLTLEKCAQRYVDIYRSVEEA